MNEGEYLDDKKHGLWTTYYANGSKRTEGHYNRGKKEGVWIQYWPSGGKKSEGAFADDKFTGPHTVYHENGNIAHHGVYNVHVGRSSDGTKEGPWTYYEEDGKTVWRIITYHHGSRTKEDDIFHPRPGSAEDKPIAKRHQGLETPGSDAGL